ncbi:PAS domain S-box-containing protein/diguanylate cyclase (GGDEF)-like protein [Hoeflea marina]|uniref:PAS domain S-box-containing protein/diguanylate cyclase (GGDEF)-like protein n=2 Tax=Hoeflea marina TaxID=274592 RepID=A0A317PI17_9HYPH|nr:PAS domain S-box-containing protein/diguanylate cyclase (GGDEF)-like protein [Hoeflea marina]
MLPVMEEIRNLMPADFIKRVPSIAGDGLADTDSIRSILPTLVEELSDGIAIGQRSGANSPLLYVNKSFERLTGYARHEVIGKDCRYLQGNERDQPEIARIRAAIEAAEPVDATLRNYRKDGSEFWNSLSLRPAWVGDALLYVAILRDVSSIRQTHIALDRVANLDGLTGCLNRQSFLLTADERFATQAEALLLVVKLDVIDFHDLNTGYGFEVGDALLCETGRRLRDLGAALVARMGANEFALAFQLPDEQSADAIVSMVTALLAADFVVAGANVSLRFAIGYAIGKPVGGTLSLIRNAGTALWAAKSDPLGGPRRFRDSDDEQARRRLRMTRELKSAVANNEFVYHFQPQVDLVTGEWLGAEALIRWNHPLFGSQLPGRFIETAERSGLLLELTERSLTTVTTFARRINAHRHKPLRFSVNVSAGEFLRHDMAELLDRILRQTGADPAWLTLEITESMFLSDTPGVIDAFERLRRIGVGLSVDDFGTGYSNLRSLERFPVTEIKIDRTFVSELATAPSKRVIVRAIIELGRALGLTVVAEGVETEAQRAMLSEMGCPVGQGYLFGVPTDEESFAASLERQATGGTDAAAPAPGIVDAKT